MSEPQPTGSAPDRETIVRALSALSDELGKKGVMGELCLFGGTANRIAVKTQYLVEGLFEEGKV